jgi:Kef-type K+ transport system membrane component KefB
MLDTTTSLLIISLAAVLAPLFSDTFHRIRIPVIVIEIALGILIGPHVLGLVQPNDVVEGFSEFGLAFLFFLAGYEIDVDRIRGRSLRLGFAGWLISLGLGLGAALALQAAGAASTILFVWLAISTTALGALLPILNDTGELDTPFGAFAMGVGAVGEFGPIALVALLLSERHGIYMNAGLLVLFAVVVIAALRLSGRWRPPRVIRLIEQTMDSSAQMAVRLSLLLLAVLVFLAEVLELDFVLGAFAAGFIVAHVVKLLGPKEKGMIEALTAKYRGIGFGFVIPIFFIVSGVHYNVQALLGSPTSLMLLPVFLLLFLLIRGLPVLLLYRSLLSREEQTALALFAATQLPLVIAITGLGVEAGALSEAIASSMVGAAMLSVFLFPMLGLVIKHRSRTPASKHLVYVRCL